MSENNFYYSCRNILSYNRLFNIVVGERGNGKTYSFKEWCINDFKKNKNEFIWLRRYETELNDIELFFMDIKNKYPNDKFKVKGGKFYCNEEIMGYYMPLSKQITKKSTPYPNVTKIIFDEYLISKSEYRYLRDEPSVLMELYSTVARLRDVKLVMIANTVTQANPYFHFFKIPLLEKQFTKVGKDIIVELTNTPEYQKKFENSRFGQIIQGTSYGEYAMHGNFIEDNHSFIEAKDKMAINIFNLNINQKIIGIWASTKEGKIYCSFKFDPSKTTYCLTLKDQQPNYMLLNTKNTHLKYLKQAIQYSYLYYEDFKVKSIMKEAFRYLSIR